MLIILLKSSALRMLNSTTWTDYKYFRLCLQFQNWVQKSLRWLETTRMSWSCHECHNKWSSEDINTRLVGQLTIFSLCVVIDCSGAVGSRIVSSSLFCFDGKHLAEGAVHLECWAAENNYQKRIDLAAESLKIVTKI